MSMLRQLRRHAAPDFQAYRRFVVAGQHVGWIRQEYARRFAAFGDCFLGDERQVAMHPRLDTAAARSEAIAIVLTKLNEEGLVPGWRDELYPVTLDFFTPPLLVLERAAATLFGTLAHGINVNGYVGQGWGMKVWVARRAATKAVDPNMLDLIVGGGQPEGLTLTDNLLKECWEEAGISAALAENAVPVGIVTLLQERPQGLRVDLQFNFDLALTEDFRPVNQDGEVSGFECLPVSELIHRLRSEDSFMYDSALVQIDFLIRHGFIGPEDPDFLKLLAGLRPPLPYDQKCAVT
jgi:8-oxo-dGTP pyrophosphatase MutT (NUDIX family)